MHKILFTLPGLGYPVQSFALALVAACFGALFLTAWRARRLGIDPEAVYGLAGWLFSGGIIGARALYIVQHPEAVHSAVDVFRIGQGGIVFYGCILGGLAGSVLYWTRHPFPFRRMCDAVAPALALAVALGRLGCFANGCCFGSVSRVAWAVTFPAGSPPWARQVLDGLIPATAARSLAVHPAQLYAVAHGLALLALLSWYVPRRRRDGAAMALLMLTYPVARFVEECLRGDEGPFVAGLTMSQAISVGLFACGLALWTRRGDGPRRRESTQGIKESERSMCLKSSM